MKLGLIYGSSSGLTEQIAFQIKTEWGAALEVYRDVVDATLDDFTRCDYLILGIPTYDYGELQSDWQSFFPKLDDIDFTGKIVALFGLGDQVAYPDTFLNAMATLGDKVVQRGARLIGAWPKDGYEYVDSLAERNGALMGLGIDVNTQGEFSEQRIKKWVLQIKREMGLNLN